LEAIKRIIEEEINNKKESLWQHLYFTFWR
jgi:hypothetical protein